MEPVSIDLRLDGRASLLSIAKAVEGVESSVDGETLVLRVSAPSLREAQVLLDRALAALNEGESSSESPWQD